MGLTVWVRIGSASTDTDKIGRSVYEQHSTTKDAHCRRPTAVHRVRVSCTGEALFHLFAPPTLGSQSLLKAKRIELRLKPVEAKRSICR